MSELSGEGTVVQSDQSLAHSRSVSTGAPPIAGYTLHEAVGIGSFGEVWVGIQDRTGQKVAVKVLRRAGSDLRNEVERLREVAEHPGVVTLLDADLSHEPPYLVLPWLRHGSLADLKERPTRAQALEWFEQMAEALAYTHEKGLLHCDFKPSNVLLDDENRVRVVDFGQSRSQGERDLVYGTLGYMAPDQATGSVPDVRWDVYSLGATMYHLLTGHVPRLTQEDLSSGLRLYADTLRERPLQPLQPADDLARIVESCLELDPEKRTRSVQAVCEDLGHLRNGEPLLCRKPWSLRYRISCLLRRPRAKALLAMSLLLVLSGVLSLVKISLQNRQLEGANDSLSQSNQALEEREQRLREESARLELQLGDAAWKEEDLDKALVHWGKAEHDLDNKALARVRFLTASSSPVKWQMPANRDLSGIAYTRFSLDSKILARSTMKAGPIEVRDAASGKLLLRQSVPSQAQFGLSPRGKLLGVIDSQGGLMVYEVEGGKKWAQSENMAAFYFPDDQTMRVLRRDGLAVEFDSARTIKQVGQVTDGPVALVTVCDSDESVVLLQQGDHLLAWDMGRMQPLSRPFPAHADRYHAQVNEKGSLWISGSLLPVGASRVPVPVGEVADESYVLDPRDELAIAPGLEFVDLRTGRQRVRVGEYHFSSRFSRDGSMLAVGDAEGVLLYGRDGRQIAGPFRFNGDVGDVTFSPDGTLLVNSTINGGIQVRLVDTESGRVRTRQADSSGWLGEGLAWSHGPKVFYELGQKEWTSPGIERWDLVGRGRALMGHQGDQVRLFSWPGRKPRFEPVGDAIDLVRDFSPSAERAVLSLASGRHLMIGAYQVDSGELRKIFDGELPRGRIPQPAAWSPDEKRFAVSIPDPSNRVEVQTWEGEVLGRYETPYAVHAIALSSQGMVAIGSLGVVFWEYQTDAQEERPGSSVYALRFSPDGKALLIVYVNEKAELVRMDQHERMGESFRCSVNEDGSAWVLADFSPDSRMLAVGYRDRLTLLDVATGEALAPGIKLGEPIRQIAFSPDSSWLMVRSGHTVRTWDCVGNKIEDYQALAETMTGLRLEDGLLRPSNQRELEKSWEKMRK